MAVLGTSAAGAAPAWREIAAGTGEYVLEMNVLMRVLGGAKRRSAGCALTRRAVQAWTPGASWPVRSTYSTYVPG